MTTFRQVVDYGDNIYCGLEPADEWKEHVNGARDEISQNLVINSKATLELMYLWKKYEKVHFLVLPDKKNQTLTIHNFIELQTKTIGDVKNKLVAEWHKNVADIYQ